jgi:hypothetical protein
MPRACPPAALPARVAQWMPPAGCPGQLPSLHHQTCLRVHNRQVPLATPGQEPRLINCSCWEWRGTAADQGDLAAEWLSEYLARPVRLVRYVGERQKRTPTSLSEYLARPNIFERKGAAVCSVQAACLVSVQEETNLQASDRAATHPGLSERKGVSLLSQSLEGARNGG